MYYSKKFKKFKKIKHCFFSRKNGYSKGIYKGLNCGRGSRDNKKNIKKNLNFVAKKMNIKRDRLLLMYQKHSNKVIEINKYNFKKRIIADAMITKMKGIALGVVTADCVPIILYDLRNEIIGCIHAGWKGAYKNILKNTIMKMKKLNPNNNIHASIGPCIGKKNYEVDLKFYKKFIMKNKKYRKYFVSRNKSKKLFNLRKFVADKLAKLKVKIDHVNHYTFAEKSKFFSYRRSCKLKQNDYGRCISTICLN